MSIFKFVYERNLLKLLQNSFNIIIKYPKVIKIITSVNLKVLQYIYIYIYIYIYMYTHTNISFSSHSPLLGKGTLRKIQDYISFCTSKKPKTD